MTACQNGVSTPELSEKSNDELADEITLLAAHIQAATCRLLVLIAEMDRREAYGDLHFKSCAHWLSWRTGDDISTAREKVRVARKLTECPRVQQAFAEGRISYSKARAITRIVTPDNEQTLLEYALEGSTSQLERIVRSYRRLAPAEQEQAARQHDRRYLSYHHDEDSEPLHPARAAKRAEDRRTVVLRGRLPPEVGALLVKALQKAEEGAGEDSAEPGQRLCDALGEVAGAALDKGLAERAGKVRSSSYQVLVHVDEAVLEDGKEQGRCEVEGPVNVSAETLRRLACDAPMLEVSDTQPGSHDGHQRSGCGHGEEECGHGDKECKLHLGRSRRRAGAPLERAVRVRDKGVCQFPGCESRGYLHLHHVKHWADGGPTSLENLTILCSFHHRAVHEGGFSVQRGEDGTLSFCTPAGFLMQWQPETVVLQDHPVEALVAEHEALALPITTESGRPGWDGITPVDYAGAVDWLLELGPSP